MMILGIEIKPIVVLKSAAASAIVFYVGAVGVVYFDLGTLDFGTREIVKDGVVCKEYYAYKDGSTLKVVCPK